MASCDFAAICCVAASYGAVSTAPTAFTPSPFIAPVTTAAIATAFSPAIASADVVSSVAAAVPATKSASADRLGPQDARRSGPHGTLAGTNLAAIWVVATFASASRAWHRHRRTAAALVGH